MFSLSGEHPYFFPPLCKGRSGGVEPYRLVTANASTSPRPSRSFGYASFGFASFGFAQDRQDKQRRGKDKAAIVNE